MNKRIAGLLSVGIALVVPALVVAQVARFSENEPLTVARMDQMVGAINNISFAQPVRLASVAGNAAGDTTTQVFTAASSGLLLFVPAGAGLGGVDGSISAVTTTGSSTIARIDGGSTMMVPVGTGQSITLTFTNAAGQTPSVNVYFTSLTSGPAPTLD